MIEFPKRVDFQHHSVFFLNLILFIAIILTFLYSLPIKYFFYFTIFITLISSYLAFPKSRAVSRTIVQTNLFLLFYFLSIDILFFLTQYLGNPTALHFLLYNLAIILIFLFFSGHYREVLNNFEKFSPSFFLALILLGFTFSLFFVFVSEPVPGQYLSTFGISESIPLIIVSLALTAFLVALTEQLIFTGFLFNSYRKMLSLYPALIYVGILFVMAHFIRIDFIFSHYEVYFSELAWLYIILYFILLFVFISTAIYLYSKRGREYSGNFAYPLILHFSTNFLLFFYYFFIL